MSEPSPEQFRAQAVAFLEAHRREAPPDYGAIMPPERRDEGMAWQQLLHAEGFAGIHRPVELGGRGLSPEHQAIWLEECARAGVPPFLNMVGLVLTVGALIRFGTPEQQRRFVPPTLRGEVVWCQLFSEPGAGSDLASLSARAEATGDGYVVNGQKVWSSGARVSEHGILLARTGAPIHDEQGRLDRRRHAGISFFCIDMDSPGIETRPLRQMTGGSEFDEVFFTEVVVPEDRLIGEAGSGWTVAMSVLTDERGSVGAAIVGLERRLAAMAAMADSGLEPHDRDRLADLMARGQALTSVARRAAAGDGSKASVLKLAMAELGFDAAELRLELEGAAGLLAGSAADNMLSAPASGIAGGTSEVQRNILGERLLGLPKEPPA